jgi:hypothetical protein
VITLTYDRCYSLPAGKSPYFRRWAGLITGFLFRDRGRPACHAARMAALQGNPSLRPSFNELDQAALPDERLKVERRFRFLKAPVFLSSTLFLKTPRRIRALMAIMTLCLLVYAAVQWRVRQALQHSQQTCPDQKGKPNPRHRPPDPCPTPA